MRPARPPDDAALAAELADLRQLTARLERAALEGEGTDRLARRRVEAEQRIIRRTRAVAGAGARADRPSVSAVIGALGDRALVELVEVDGGLLGLVVAGGRVAMRRLGERDEVHAELAALRFGLRRLALGRGAEGVRRAFRDSVAHSALRLDELLLEPVSGLIGSRALVVVPTGALHALPWAVLPSAPGGRSWWPRAPPCGCAPSGPAEPRPRPGRDDADRRARRARRRRRDARAWRASTPAAGG